MILKWVYNVHICTCVGMVLYCIIYYSNELRSITYNLNQNNLCGLLFTNERKLSTTFLEQKKIRYLKFLIFYDTLKP